MATKHRHSVPYRHNSVDASDGKKVHDAPLPRLLKSAGAATSNNDVRNMMLKAKKAESDEAQVYDGSVADTAGDGSYEILYGIENDTTATNDSRTTYTGHNDPQSQSGQQERPFSTGSLGSSVANMSVNSEFAWLQEKQPNLCVAPLSAPKPAGKHGIASTPKLSRPQTSFMGERSASDKKISRREKDLYRQCYHQNFGTTPYLNHNSKSVGSLHRQFSTSRNNSYQAATATASPSLSSEVGAGVGVGAAKEDTHISAEKDRNISPEALPFQQMLAHTNQVNDAKKKRFVAESTLLLPAPSPSKGTHNLG